MYTTNKNDNRQSFNYNPLLYCYKQNGELYNQHYHYYPHYQYCYYNASTNTYANAANVNNNANSIYKSLYSIIKNRNDNDSVMFMNYYRDNDNKRSKLSHQIDYVDITKETINKVISNNNNISSRNNYHVNNDYHKNLNTDTEKNNTIINDAIYPRDSNMIPKNKQGISNFNSNIDINSNDLIPKTCDHYDDGGDDDDDDDENENDDDDDENENYDDDYDENENDDDDGDDDDDENENDGEGYSTNSLKTLASVSSSTTTIEQHDSFTSDLKASRDDIKHLQRYSDVESICERYCNDQFKDDVSFDQYAGLVDRYGFEISNEKRKPILKSFDLDKRMKKKEIKRTQKWESLLSKNKSVSRSGRYGETSYQFIWNKKFTERVYKGVPDSWRSKVWYFILTTRQNDAGYDKFLIRTYKALLNEPSAYERYIDLDVPRTFQTHIMFKSRYGPGQRSMFNVLKAFSNYDEQVGFCQGMANIVAILLLYYSEADAFVMLVKLSSKCNLHNLYIPGFPSLMEGFYIQKKLMRIYVSKLTDHLEKLDIICTSYATKWYITLFSADIVSHRITLRFWDLIMLNGFDILYYIAVALLIYNQSKLLKSDFDKSMKILTSKMRIENEEKLFRTIKKLFKNRKNKIDMYKDEYKKLQQSDIDL